MYYAVKKKLVAVENIDTINIEKIDISELSGIIISPGSGTPELSFNACCDVAFRMDKLRRPLRLSKISKLNSIATLLPDCLRLALSVTRQHPRLANGGSLRLTVWDFHPLNQSPFSGRAHPFTEPAVIPAMIYFCANI